MGTSDETRHVEHTSEECCPCKGGKGGKYGYKSKYGGGYGYGGYKKKYDGYSYGGYGSTNPNMEEDTKLNMEVVMAMSLPCMVVMSSLLTEDKSHRLMEVTRLPCMEATNSHPTEDMKRLLMEATYRTEVPDTEVIPWVMEAFRPLRFTGLTLRMTTQ